MKLFLLSACLFVACLAQSPEKQDWVEEPYGNRDFNGKAEYGDNLFLVCNDSRVDGTSFTVKKWIRPDLEIMYPNETYMFWSLDGTAGWEVSDDGLYMNITLVQEEHFGVYYCITEQDDDATEIVVKVGLNMWGPDYGDTWAKYKDATIWASSVTLAFLISIIVGFILFTRNEEPEVWESEKDREEKEQIAKMDAMELKYSGKSNMGFDEGTEIVDEVSTMPSNGHAKGANGYTPTSQSDHIETSVL